MSASITAKSSEVRKANVDVSNIDKDPNMNDKQKDAVKKSIEVLAKHDGKVSEMSKDEKKTVQAGDKAWNATHDDKIHHVTSSAPNPASGFAPAAGLTMRG